MDNFLNKIWRFDCYASRNLQNVLNQSFHFTRHKVTTFSFHEHNNMDTTCNLNRPFLTPTVSKNWWKTYARIVTNSRWWRSNIFYVSRIINCWCIFKSILLYNAKFEFCTLSYARTLHNFPSFENGFRTMDMKTKIVKHKFGWVDFVRCCQIVCKF